MDSHGTGFLEQDDQQPGVQKNPTLPPMTHRKHGTNTTPAARLRGAADELATEQ